MVGMVVTCPSCSGRFVVRNPPGQTAFGKCSACGHVFVVTHRAGADGHRDGEDLPDLALLEPPDSSSTDGGEFTAMGTVAGAAPEIVSHRERAQAILLKLPSNEVIELTKFQTTLGRRNSDVTLADLDVSRQHAVIEQYDDKFLVKDLESSNGTYVNGVRTLVSFLVDGDVIRLGSTELRFRLATVVDLDATSTA